MNDIWTKVDTGYVAELSDLQCNFKGTLQLPTGQYFSSVSMFLKYCEPIMKDEELSYFEYMSKGSKIIVFND